jgi:hypothetical protein
MGELKASQVLAAGSWMGFLEYAVDNQFLSSVNLAGDGMSSNLQL